MNARETVLSLAESVVEWYYVLNCKQDSSLFLDSSMTWLCEGGSFNYVEFCECINADRLGIKGDRRIIKSSYKVSKDFGDTIIVTGSSVFCHTDDGANAFFREHPHFNQGYNINTGYTSKLFIPEEAVVTIVFRRVCDGKYLIVHGHALLSSYDELALEQLKPRQASLKDSENEVGLSESALLLREKTEYIDMLCDCLSSGLKSSIEDEGYTFFYVSDKLCQMLGYTREEFMAMSGGTAVGASYGPDREYALKKCEECFKKGDSYALEYRMIKKDGTLLWVQDSGRKFRGRNGKVIINSIITDISSKKSLELALIQEQERYRVALDSSDDILFEYSVSEDTFHYYHPDTSSGLQREHIILRNFFEMVKSGCIVHSDDIETLLGAFSSGIFHAIEVRFLNVSLFAYKQDSKNSSENINGDYRWFRMQGAVVSDNQAGGDGHSNVAVKSRIIGTLRNVDDLREAEMRGNLVQSSLRMAIKGLYSAVIEVNITRGTCRLLEIEDDSIGRCMSSVRQAYSYEEKIKSVLKYIHPEDRETFALTLSLENIIRFFAAGHRFLYLEHRRKVSYNGENYKWYAAELVAADLYVGETYGSEMSAICFLHDIDDRKRQEADNKRREERFQLVLKKSCESFTEIDVDSGEYVTFTAAKGLLPSGGRVEHSGDVKGSMDSGFGDYSIGSTNIFLPAHQSYQDMGNYDYEMQCYADRLVAIEHRDIFLRTFCIDNLIYELKTLGRSEVTAEYVVFKNSNDRNASISLDAALQHGQIAWMERSCSYIPEENRIISYTRNITKLKEAHWQANKERQELTSALSIMYEEFLIINLSTGLYSCARYNDLPVGVYSEGVFSDALSIYGKVKIHQEDVNTFYSVLNIDNIRSAFSKGIPRITAEVRRKNPAGEYQWVEYVILKIENISEFDDDRVICAYQNINQRRKIEMERNLSNERFGMAMRNSYDEVYEGSLVTGELYSIHYGVDGFEKRKEQKTVYEFFYSGLSNNLHPEDRGTFIEKFKFDRLLQKLDENPQGIYVEVRRRLQEGAPYYWHSYVLQKTAGQPGFATLFLKNIDEVKREQERTRQTLKDALLSAEQANYAKSEFFSRMSHDIRTPMNAIIGITAIARDYLDSGILACSGNESETEIPVSRLRGYLEKIDCSANFLLSLVNDVLDMSKIESGKVALYKEPFDFKDFVQSLTLMFYSQATDKGVDFRVKFDGIMDEAYIGDKLRLNQILINLLSNAIKFTHAGGNVVLEIRQIRVTGHHSTLQFIVRDTGVGMSKEFVKKIYHPFEQEQLGHNIEGTGLGMAITQNLVQMMGGYIDVKSERGVGSEFTIEVRLERVRLSDASLPTLDLGELKVLVVDDDEMVCHYTTKILGNLGTRAEWVQSGEEAIARIREHINTEEAYDVILLDWKMPGMCGVEAARIIRGIAGPDTLVIIVSAYNWTDIEEEARAAGVNFFLSKPMFESNLRDLMRTITGKKPISFAASLDPKSIMFDSQRVLLVEDNELNLEIAMTLLSSRNLIVETACDGAEAVERFGASEPGYFKLILMDVRMPKINGLDATRIIRAMDRPDAATVPIIAMTANAFKEDIEQSRRAGMNFHLAKPIDVAVLYQTLKEYLP